MYDINIIKKYNLIYVLLFKKTVVMNTNILCLALCLATIIKQKIFN